MALPILLLDNIPKTNASAGQNVAAAAPATTSTSTSTTVTTLPPTTEPPTTVDAAPATAAAPPTTVHVTSTTAKPKAAVAPTTAPPTTAPPTTAAPTATSSSGGSQDGAATYYDYRPGECAHLTIPKGTLVTVTNVANGASTTCVVTDRGPYGAGRIIDLDRSTFSQIASIDAGVIQVHLSW